VARPLWRPSGRIQSITPLPSSFTKQSGPSAPQPIKLPKDQSKLSPTPAALAPRSYFVTPPPTAHPCTNGAGIGAPHKLTRPLSAPGAGSGARKVRRKLSYASDAPRSAAAQRTPPARTQSVRNVKRLHVKIPTVPQVLLCCPPLVICRARCFVVGYRACGILCTYLCEYVCS
jgi:hypothetical protein